MAYGFGLDASMPNHVHICSGAGRRTLADALIHRPAEDWRAWLREENAGTLTSLRREGWVGRPVGSAAFVKRAEVRLERSLVRGKPGRPPKQASSRGILFKSQGAKVERASLPVCRFFFFK
jgi:hypothetical protein